MLFMCIIELVVYVFLEAQRLETFKKMNHSTEVLFFLHFRHFVFKLEIKDLIMFNHFDVVCSKRLCTCHENVFLGRLT